MTSFQDVFKRTEIKYLLTEEQYRALRERLTGIARVDKYGETDILNIYYDTPDYRLIRDSLMKPVYKEKLRLRTYGTPKDGTAVSFIEIKKKYKGIVYKRRIDAPLHAAERYLSGRGELLQRSQIKSEIDSMLAQYPGIRPAMAISYTRIAMAGIEDSELRITFDKNIRWRTDNLNLYAGPKGEDILAPGQYLMEMKIKDAFPLHLSRILSELGIFPISFSKYGRGYEIMTARALAAGVNTVYAGSFAISGEKGEVAYA